MKSINLNVLLIILIFTLLNTNCKCPKELKTVDNFEKKVSVQWRVTELIFMSSKSYQSNFDDVDLDVVYTHTKDGTEIRIPGFWDGENIWKVRFAPTMVGNWTYKTVCSDTLNTGLNDKTGSLFCSEYKGDLDIYKHGFIKTTPNTRYFTYSDGTPFFYLGDTHWNIPVNSTANFKTIMDKRVEQGFTVIQSEPIGAGYNLKDGITDSDILYFSKLDERFKYIADKGLVHANAELIYSGELGPDRSVYTDAYLEKLCRYWVARYSAYPVIWTTAQESDNDFYHGRPDENGSDSNPYFDSKTNPWKIVANYIYKYDPYHHPQTAHQEYVTYTKASTSSFRNLPGHSWWAVQWGPKKDGQLNFNIPKDYWNNGQDKPSILYEGLYDHLWTNEFGARMQGWTAFLNGMYGYGYGVEDIWLYNSTYDINKQTVREGITISVADKKIKWAESVNLNSAKQMGYMHNFFKSIDWWNLIPRFDNPTWFTNNGSWYSLASKNNDLYVVYFYNDSTKKSGTLKNMANTQYIIQWFNPITGKYNDSITVTVTNCRYAIGDKPDNNDWVLKVMKK